MQGWCCYALCIPALTSSPHCSRLGLCILDLKEPNHFLSIRDMKIRCQNYELTHCGQVNVNGYFPRLWEETYASRGSRRWVQLEWIFLNLKLYWLWKLFLFFLMFPTHFCLPFLTLMCGSCSIRFCHRKFEKAKPGFCLIFAVTLSVSLAHINGISHIHRNRRKRWSQRSKEIYLLIRGVGKLIAN